MTTFEDLKFQWENQLEPKTPSKGSKSIIEKMVFLKKKQKITNIVLSITAIILISFFCYIAAYKHALVAMALLLMIGSLLIRMLIEHFSMKTLKQINISLNASVFKQKMIDYYKKRIKTHYIITPILILSYVFGFVILLPFFKESLSYGFYTYIQVSAIIILVIMVAFIRKQIQKELIILRHLL